MFTTYKELTTFTIKPMKFPEHVSLPGTRDEIWVAQLLQFISRVSYQDKDLECFNFVVPLLSLISTHPVIDQLLMATELLPCKSRYTWDGTFNGTVEMSNKYPVWFYNWFFAGNYKCAGRRSGVTEERDLERLQNINSDIKRLFRDRRVYRFQELPVECKTRLLKWLVYQVIQSSKYQQFIGSLEGQRGRALEDRKRAKSEVRGFSNQEEAQKRHGEFKKLRDGLTDEVGRLKQRIERQLKNGQTHYVAQNRQRLEQRQRELHAMSYKKYEQELLQRVKQKVARCSHQVNKVSQIMSGCSLGSDCLSNSYYAIDFDSAHYLMVQTPAGEVYIINNRKIGDIADNCQSQQLRGALLSLELYDTEVADTHGRCNKVLSFAQLEEMKVMDSNDINNFLKGFTQLPFHCRYMLNSKGARRYVLGEGTFEELGKGIWGGQSEQK